MAVRTDMREEKPTWLLSCYGHARGGPNDLTGDVSFEEARLANMQVGGWVGQRLMRVVGWCGTGARWVTGRQGSGGTLARVQVGQEAGRAQGWLT